jgi:hypothetical protein
MGAIWLRLVIEKIEILIEEMRYVRF